MPVCPMCGRRYVGEDGYCSDRCESVDFRGSGFCSNGYKKKRREEEDDG